MRTKCVSSEKLLRLHLDSIGADTLLTWSPTHPPELFFPSFLTSCLSHESSSPSSGFAAIFFSFDDTTDYTAPTLYLQVFSLSLYIYKQRKKLELGSFVAFWKNILCGSHGWCALKLCAEYVVGSSDDKERLEYADTDCGTFLRYFPGKQ